ncbi:hypothetical protein E2C01_025382 [Portunus trituberculatus]|uniref:Uncharacterized protein n=1 Tax=Portunus trituberculatus TaxID=210409 RepID=A0A5B7EFM6_PORTR|nr:hypothetical protein [Portunus trituberculatus]
MYAESNDNVNYDNELPKHSYPLTSIILSSVRMPGLHRWRMLRPSRSTSSVQESFFPNTLYKTLHVHLTETQQVQWSTLCGQEDYFSLPVLLLML